MSHFPPYLLRVSRLGWLLLAGLLLVLLVSAGPRALETLQTPCPGRLCVRGQVHIGQLGELAGHGLSVQGYGALLFGLRLGGALLSAGLAGLIFLRRPDDWMALQGALTLLIWGVNASELLFPLDERGPALRLLGQTLGTMGTVQLTLFFSLFPSGTFVPRWTRWAAPLWALAVPLLDLLPLVVPPSPALGRLTSLALDAWMATLVLAQVVRYRRTSGPAQRQQTKWVLAGVVTAFGGFALLDALRLATVALAPARVPPLALPALALVHAALMPLVPLAFGMAILRARLYEIDLLISRALVYGALTVGLIGGSTLLASGLGALLHSRGDLLTALLAAALAGALFEPLRARLQRAANRLLYGERDDPYAVVARLGQQLAAALPPDQLLPAVAQTVREALRLPYAAVELAGAPGAQPLAQNLVCFPLVHQGEPVGRLLLAPRHGERDFGPADRRLLADLARQVGAAAHAVRLHADAQRLAADLQRSREQLVAAREEERRRLRRDLHDGLGPVLAALALQADIARDLIDSDPQEARALLGELTAQAQGTVAEVRRLIYALRPPALDEFGLVGAIRAYAAGAALGGLPVALDAPDPLPPLPAAVEVAAYRIAQEALSNVARHARAAGCVVRLRACAASGQGPGAGPVLVIDITDSGIGIDPQAPAGVGLSSMRERAHELGGDCLIGPADGGGTTVHATLPLGK